jgi:hypothetical protein
VSVFGAIRRDWPQMRAADRVRVVLAFGFPLGAILHVGWVIYHGDIFYRGPAPTWAPAFWYGLCVIDFGVCWLMLARPRLGVASAALTMITTLSVNWTQFPTFELQFNYVLLGLTLFGAIVLVLAGWLWRASRWRLTPTSGHSAG